MKSPRAKPTRKNQKPHKLITEAITTPDERRSRTCADCKAGPFKNVFGLVVHKGRIHRSLYPEHLDQERSREGLKQAFDRSQAVINGSGECMRDDSVHYCPNCGKDLQNLLLPVDDARVLQPSTKRKRESGSFVPMKPRFCPTCGVPVDLHQRVGAIEQTAKE